MIRDLGIVEPGTTLYIPFHTFDSNDPSASVTLTGLATTDIEVYKDGSVTQRASDAGYALLDTDGIDFDTTTGIHGISINLADNTTAGFYASGSQYWVVIASVTVDAATINFVLCTFRIGYPGARLNTTIATLASQTSFTLTSGPAEDDALNGCYCIIHDVASAVQVGHAIISDYTGSTKTVTLAAGTTFTAAATDNIAIMGPAPLQPTVAARTLDVSAGGEAGVDWANVGTPSSSVSLSGTTVATVTTTTTASNLTTNNDKTGYSLTNLTVTAGTTLGAGTHTAQTGDAYARLGAPVGASISADIATVDANVDAVLADTGTDGVVVAAGSKTGYSLTATTGLGNQTADITGNLSGSVGSVTGAVGSVTGNVGGNVTGSIGSLGATAKSDVNAEVVDALNTDTYAEPGQEAPGATVSLAKKISYLYKLMRNKITQTSTTLSIYDDAGTTVDQKATVSDDGSTYTRGEIGTGP